MTTPGMDGVRAAAAHDDKADRSYHSSHTVIGLGGHVHVYASPTGPQGISIGFSGTDYTTLTVLYLHPDKARELRDHLTAALDDIDVAAAAGIIQARADL